MFGACVTEDGEEDILVGNDVAGNSMVGANVGAEGATVIVEGFELGELDGCEG